MRKFLLVVVAFIIVTALSACSTKMVDLYFNEVERLSIGLDLPHPWEFSGSRPLIQEEIENIFGRLGVEIYSAIATFDANEIVDTVWVFTSNEIANYRIIDSITISIGGSFPHSPAFFDAAVKYIHDVPTISHVSKQHWIWWNEDYYYEVSSVFWLDGIVHFVHVTTSDMPYRYKDDITKIVNNLIRFPINFSKITLE